MKILLVTPEYPPYGSGIANAVYSIKMYLQKKGVKVDVLSQRGADINLNSMFRFFPGISSLIPFWQKAANYIIRKAREYDVIWLHSPILLDAKNLRYINRIMVTFHTTYYGFYQAYKMHNIKRFLPYYCLATELEHQFLKQLSYNNNIIVTAVSPSVAEELRRNGLNLFPFIVPNGVAVNNRSTLNKKTARTLLQQEFLMQISEKDLVLLYVGRITEQKQPMLLINLFKTVTYVKPNTHLVLIGTGNLLSKARKETISYQNIYVLGCVENKYMPIFLSAADAFISLSCYEGLPLAVLEAASYGLPLILSDIPAHRWIIASKVGRGILVNPYHLHPMQILDFLDKIIKGKTFNAVFKNHFAWENIVNQYLNLMNSI